MNLFRSLTVLSIEQATTLPFMTLRLAQDGMRVIRVENPPRGDPNRWVGPPVLPADSSENGFEPGMNAYFLPNNLGKQSITLDLSQEEGKKLLHTLIRELPVDIFATNQRPRAYRKLGIDYDALSQLKPDLIWVGITGFGPGSDEAAYDPILQARSGFMALTGEKDGDPLVFGLPMVDLGAGEHAYGQVMRALYRRSATGEGARLDISMFQSAVSWMVSPVLLYASFGIPTARHGNTHQFFAPVSVYPTQDGYVYLAVGNDRQWEAITKLPGFEGLAKEKFAQNAGRIAAAESINQEIAQITRQTSTAPLLEAFQKIGVPVSQVKDIPDVCRDSLVTGCMVRSRDSLSGVEIVIPSPAVISDFLQHNEMRLDFPPRLGEHNQEVFSQIGLNVTDLEGRGVI